MPLAVSDSDILIHLAKLRELSILKQLYGTILIPNTVYQEVVEEGLKEKRKDARLVKSAINKGWISVERDVKEELAITLALRHQIHMGQGYVIALALQKNVKTALLNESRVRKAARSEGLNEPVAMCSPATKSDMLSLGKAAPRYQSLRIRLLGYVSILRTRSYTPSPYKQNQQNRHIPILHHKRSL